MQIMCLLIFTLRHKKENKKVWNVNTNIYIYILPLTHGSPFNNPKKNNDRLSDI